MQTEADTCRTLVLPKLYKAGWNDDQIGEQRSFTDGRIVVAGNKAWRRPQKRADYLLRHRSGQPLAVIETKASHHHPGDGIQQAKGYAEILDLKFAYSTNGHEIFEFDLITGKEALLKESPTPRQLLRRLNAHLGLPDPEREERFLSATPPVPEKEPRYYQRIAVNRDPDRKRVTSNHDDDPTLIATGDSLESTLKSPKLSK